MMTATYSPDDNKLRLYSVARLDPETYRRVKAAGFVWAAKQDLFVAPMWTPEREDLLIDLCGEIGDEDTSLVDRAEQRADRFEEYRDKRADDSARASAAVHAIADGIPLGQPILVGHHSERHARRDAEKIENGMRRAVNFWRTSEYWARRAKGALLHAKYKELPGVRARRIKTIEADRRRFERTKAEAADRLRLFLLVDQPEKWKTRADGTFPTRDERAFILAGRMSGAYLGTTADGHPFCAYDVLRPEGERYKMHPAWTVDQVIARLGEKLDETTAHCDRWIAHCDRRLEYERAMLNEQGRGDLLAPKPRTKTGAAALPLCNYEAPDGLQIANEYHRGQFMHYPQARMTKAEYAAIGGDYKGTRPVNGTHRVRTAMLHHPSRLVCVFLTDAKTHTPPAAVAQNAAPVAQVETSQPARESVPAAAVAVASPGVLDPAQAAQVAAMAASLRAGVAVVSAPQLFPTPPVIAARMVDAARLEPGHRVLEPSAGTGRIVDAIAATGIPVHLVAVEVSNALARRLNTMPAVSTTIEADFLQVFPNVPSVDDHRPAATAEDARFDRVIMNPPFERGADVEHIRHALRHLRPGGRLVALCADGPRQRAALEPIATSYDPLPAGSFAAEGTNVRVALVVIDKGTEARVINDSGPETYSASL